MSGWLISRQRKYMKFYIYIGKKYECAEDNIWEQENVGTKMKMWEQREYEYEK